MSGPEEEASLLSEARKIVDSTGESNLDWEDFNQAELRLLHKRGSLRVDERAKDLAERQYKAARELGDTALVNLWRTYIGYMND